MIAVFELAKSIYEGAELLDADTDADAGPSSPTALELNEAFVEKAGVLAFATDQSIFWGGIDRLVGEPDESISLVEAMEKEHCCRADADAPFHARNYGTRTSSRVEWHFVSRPHAIHELADHLTALGTPPGEWPQGDRASCLRTTLSFGAYKGSRAGRKLDARLGVEGEQSLSEAEFLALRAYTGPMFEKYNVVLRSATAAIFRKMMEELQLTDNRYETTIHLLSAAVIKLSKLTSVSTVYRAPGRAMPPEFWRHALDGLAGVIETGARVREHRTPFETHGRARFRLSHDPRSFVTIRLILDARVGMLSTSANKDVALEYAGRSDAKLLFELRLGFVSRGADIGQFELSQYPSEGEILLPPLTALQVSNEASAPLRFFRCLPHIGLLRTAPSRV